MFIESLKRVLDRLSLSLLGEMVRIELDVEGGFDIALPDDPNLRIKTVCDLYRLTVLELQTKGPVHYQSAWLKMAEIVGRYAGKSPDDIKPGHRFLEDLGMD